MNQSEIFADVTNRMIRLIEQGVPPWRKPWMASATGLPRNALSNRVYNGINFWLLLLAAEEHGWDTNQWATFQQYKKINAYVNRGEKSEKIVYWDIVKETAIDNRTGEKKETQRIFARRFSVFNLSQCGGEGLKRFRQSAPTTKRFENYEPAERLIEAIDVDIRFGGNRACYNTTKDFIQLPHKESFDSTADFYSTCLHEIAHASGHPSRLNRIKKLERYNEQKIGMEELIAEMCSANLCMVLGIENKAVERQSASYLASWLEVLKEDKSAIISAATAAQKAATFILSFCQEPDSVESEEVAAVA